MSLLPEFWSRDWVVAEAPCHDCYPNHRPEQGCTINNRKVAISFLPTKNALLYPYQYYAGWFCDNVPIRNNGNAYQETFFKRWYDYNVYEAAHKVYPKECNGEKETPALVLIEPRLNSKPEQKRRREGESETTDVYVYVHMWWRETDIIAEAEDRFGYYVLSSLLFTLYNHDSTDKQEENSVVSLVISHLHPDEQTLETAVFLKETLEAKVPMIGRVPTLWKTSRIVPVPKKNRPSELNDFRPVALTSHLMKTLERLFLSLLRPQVQHAQDRLQFAYQPGVGVEDAILYLLH
ncbi:hypothetical protein L3Q82_006680 [Scortum barcoo]|uniref:Uncharacterized protein n=1 Tax=Scortum barcoo TaxID=214431 RepID=A0ACB8WVI8_9TELE|nr:hypothetical protein L3Q82_006680 [Scortum barcoo]